MIRGFFRILTLLLVGAFCFALGVYTGPTEPVVQLRASLEEKIASALQSLRVQTDKAKLPAKEATRPPQPAPAASSAPELSAAAPAPAESETGGMGAQAPAQAEGANPGTAESGESPSNAPSAPQAAEPPAAASTAAQPAPAAEPAPATQAPVVPKAKPKPKPKLPD